MDIISLAIGAISGGALVAIFFLLNRKSNDNQNDVSFYKSELENAKTEANTMRVRIESLIHEIATNKTSLEAAYKALESEKLLMEDLKANLKVEFKNLSNDIFEERLKKLNEANESHLSVTLTPLRTTINEFKSKLEQTEIENVDRSARLENEIKNLREASSNIGTNAENLTRALKGDNKAQGNWGEMILESVLEKSGLEKGKEFIVQHSDTNDDEQTIRPDVIVNLPENKHIIVDSKVSLTAYNNYANAQDDKEKATFMRGHLDSVRSHIKKLSEKKYESADKLTTPEFVLLFMPIEPALIAAFNEDSNLFSYAWERNIILVSPTTLLATLRTVASIWAQEKRSKNAESIAKEAGTFIDKLEGFVTSLEGLETNLNTAQKTLSKAMGQLKTGQGNLLGKAKKMKIMGAKAGSTFEKRLPSIDDDEVESTDEQN
ncbi:MAG: recombination protein RmuC [Bacteroidota bacterium]|jgi:DNA recombination protein RmuC